MHVGIPREIKDHEYRVGMLPAGVKALVAHGHRVSVETGAGAGVGATDEAYAAAGAKIGDAPAVWGAELVVKVKEPQAVERARLRPGQILFTYLHLAPDRAQTDELLASGATAIAYETVTAADGSLPLLTPMSEIAGRLAPQAGAHWLEKAQGGRGVLLGGVPGVAPAGVLVLGGGVAGTHAATIALGMGAQVTVMDRAAPVLRRLDAQFGGRVHTRFATPDAIAQVQPTRWPDRGRRGPLAGGPAPLLGRLVTNAGARGRSCRLGEIPHLPGWQSLGRNARIEAGRSQERRRSRPADPPSRLP